MKIIIGWEITQDIQARMLKIDQKAYILDLLESEKRCSCHPTVFLMKASLFLKLDQARELV